MTTTQKIAITAIFAFGVGVMISQIQKRPEDPGPGGKAVSAVSSAGRVPGTKAKKDARIAGKMRGGPRALLRPRLNGEFPADPSAVLSSHDNQDKWSGADYDLLVAWAVKDPEAALKWVIGGEHFSTDAALLGAVAAGILLHDGKEAMERFIAEYQDDPRLLKHGGQFEECMFYHLGREDTFDAAMEILETMKDGEDEKRLFRAGEWAGAMIHGIEGAQNMTSAIDYMEAKGIPVNFDYWSHQDAIDEDPRYWATWALQRDSKELSQIVDAWARENIDEAKAWTEEYVPTNNEQRAELDDMLRERQEDAKTVEPDPGDAYEPDMENDPE